MSATTTQLLSSGEFCKLCYDTTPVKSASAKFLSILITQKYHILSCDTLVANEWYKYWIQQTAHSIINICIISGFLRDVDEICIILGYYAE